MSGEEVTITLEKESSSSPDFKGFMIQARDNSGNPIGEFLDFDTYVWIGLFKNEYSI